MSGPSPRQPRLQSLYERYLQTQDSGEFIAGTSRYYTLGSLERLAQNDQRCVRRAAVLALGFLGDYSVNHTLGRALLDDDRTVRMLAENSIRTVWTQVGSHSDRQELTALVALNAARHYGEVVRRAESLLAQAPWFAEVWNQRAIARFNLGQFAEAVRDCHQALEINPYHFLAAAGMGQCYLELNNPVSALESFRRALRLNPDLDGVRVQVVRLAKVVEERK